MSQPVPSPEHTSGKEWFEKWFNHPFYLELYRHRNHDEAVRCIDTIMHITGLEKTKQSLCVLDIACGAGRHAIELARRGHQVTANDLSPFLLEQTRNEAANAGVALTTSCCDMRNIPPGAFDLIVQLFTSFGYFDSEEEDRKVLGKARNALGHNGWYVLDLVNPTSLKEHLVPESHRMAGKLKVHERRSMQEKKITKEITITSPEGTSLEFIESVSLYSLKQISVMLEESGFTVKGIIGDYDGSLWNASSSPRMMLFSKAAHYPNNS